MSDKQQQIEILPVICFYVFHCLRETIVCLLTSSCHIVWLSFLLQGSKEAFTQNWFGVHLPLLVWLVFTPVETICALNNAPWFSQKGWSQPDSICAVMRFAPGENSKHRKRTRGELYYWLFDCDCLMKWIHHRNFISWRFWLLTSQLAAIMLFPVILGRPN